MRLFPGIVPGPLSVWSRLMPTMDDMDDIADLLRLVLIE